MPELGRLKSRLETTETLLTLVRNVKALAAVSIREQQMQSEALARYEETVLNALSVTAKLGPEGKEGALPTQSQNSVGQVVIGSDRGLCGPFNQRLAQQLEPGVGPILVIGYRMGRELERRGHEVEATLASSSTPSETHQVVGRVLDHIVPWLESGISEIRILRNVSRHSGLDFQAQKRSFLPLDSEWWAKIRARKWKSAKLPICLGEPALSQKLLMRQWMYITLAKNLAESGLAESGARLATMQSAEKNIGENLSALERAFRQHRQARIDAELLDISAGFEMSSKEGEATF